MWYNVTVWRRSVAWLNCYRNLVKDEKRVAIAEGGEGTPRARSHTYLGISAFPSIH